MQKPEEPNVKVIRRSICVTVVIPEAYIGEFIRDYGFSFKMHDSVGGGDRIAEIDSCSYHPNGWQINVKVPDFQELKLYGFLGVFCGLRGIKLDEQFLDLRSVIQLLYDLGQKAISMPADMRSAIIPPKKQFFKLLEIIDHFKDLYIEADGMTKDPE